MDTPGLLDTETSDEDTGVIIVKAVINMHPGPDAVLYVIGQGKYTRQDFDAYERFKKLFGAEVVSHMILIFTGGDIFRQEDKNFEEVLVKAPENLRTVVRECGERYVVFNNKSHHPEQVQRLLNSVTALAEKNAYQPYKLTNYSTVGDTLENEVKERLRDFKQAETEKLEEVRSKLLAQAMETQLNLENEREQLRRQKEQEAEELKKEKEVHEAMKAKERQEQIQEWEKLEQREKKVKSLESIATAMHVVEEIGQLVHNIGRVCVNTYNCAQTADKADLSSRCRCRAINTRQSYGRSCSGPVDDVQKAVERIGVQSMTRSRGANRNSAIDRRRSGYYQQNIPD